MKKFIYILMLLPWPFFSQELLQVQDLKTQIEQKNDSIIKQIEHSKISPLWAILPTINYDIINNNISIGLSISSFITAKKQSKRNNIYIENLRQNLESKKINQLDKTQKLIDDFYFNLEILNLDFELYKIQKQTFEISQGKYQNGKITTEEFLKIQSFFMIKKISLKKKVYKIKQLYTSICKGLNIQYNDDFLLKFNVFLQ